MTNAKTVVKAFLIFLTLSISFTGLAAAQDVELEDFPNDMVVEEEDDNSESVPVNGTIIFSMNITSQDGKDSAELLDYSFNESYNLKQTERRATGYAGSTHSIELIDKNGNIIKEREFRLNSTSVIDARHPNGTQYTILDTEAFEEHEFKFKANYSAQEIRIKEGETEIFSLNIRQETCTGTEVPHYCEYNDQTETEVPEERNSSENTEPEFDLEQVKQLADTYNSEIDSAPSFLKSLVGDQDVNMYIGSNATYSFDMAGAKIENVRNQSFEKPSLEIWIEQTDIETVSNSEQPLQKTSEMLKNETIEYRSNGFVNSLKFGIFNLFL